jgi:C4-dicarboxylate-specific signal transduction histidine kinase
VSSRSTAALDCGTCAVAGEWHGPLHEHANDVTVSHVSASIDSREQEHKLAHIAKLASLGEMATGMAHELSQPLAAIGVATEILLESAEGGVACTEEATRRLRGIRQQVDRARGIIDRMCDFGRICARDLAPVSLASVVAEALTLVGPALQAETISLVVDIPLESAPVRAVQQPLEQVIINLLVNSRDAFRFSSRQNGSGRRAVHVAPRCHGAGTIGLIVEDSAGGIDPEALPRIFDPFFTTKPAGAGTGIGLSISRAIISRFGGTLIASNAQHGARFGVTLHEWTAQAGS